MNCRSSLSLLLCAVFAVIVGCSSETDHATVEGTVTLDGKPLETGLIRFVPVDGQTPSSDATITAGKFAAQVPLGEKRVTISAPKVVGKRKMYEAPNTPTIDVVEELLPPRYNAASQLVLPVEPGSQNPEFNLESR